MIKRRKNYLNDNGYGLSGDGDGKDYQLWYGPGRDKMTFEQAWERLMEYQGLPLDWEPPMYFERLSCVGCRGEHGVGHGGAKMSSVVGKYAFLFKALTEEARAKLELAATKKGEVCRSLADSAISDLLAKLGFYDVINM